MICCTRVILKVVSIMSCSIKSRRMICCTRVILKVVSIMSCHLFFIKNRLYFLTFRQQSIKQKFQVQRALFSCKIGPYYTVSMHGWLYKKRVIRRFIHALFRNWAILHCFHARMAVQKARHPSVHSCPAPQTTVYR